MLENNQKYSNRHEQAIFVMEIFNILIICDVTETINRMKERKKQNILSIL